MGEQELAVHEGTPVASEDDWPTWPEVDAGTEGAVVAVLRSGLWTLTGARRSNEVPKESLFATRFRQYVGGGYCVPVDHGSSALVIALQAAEVGPGDEVIVPALTWVASATAVLRVGATPIFVDVDVTGCISADAIRTAISPQTRAVVAVHLACAVANLDQIVDVCRAAGMVLIEDCAQAHGAEWRATQVGNWGDMGAFSFQGGKVLTSGEGGAVITSDATKYQALQELRADSRSYPDMRGQCQDVSNLVESATIMGTNYCMSELAAAILLDQIESLDEQHERRETSANVILQRLDRLGLQLFELDLPPQVTRRSIYEYCLTFDPTSMPVSAEVLAGAISAELQAPVFTHDTHFRAATSIGRHQIALTSTQVVSMTLGPSPWRRA